MRIEYGSLNENVQRYLDEESFRAMIAKCAYYKSEKRGFVDGFELQDWLEAEQEMCRQCPYWFQEY